VSFPCIHAPALALQHAACCPPPHTPPRACATHSSACRARQTRAPTLLLRLPSVRTLLLLTEPAPPELARSRREPLACLPTRPPLHLRALAHATATPSLAPCVRATAESPHIALAHTLLRVAHAYCHARSAHRSAPCLEPPAAALPREPARTARRPMPAPPGLWPPSACACRCPRAQLLRPELAPTRLCPQAAAPARTARPRAPASLRTRSPGPAPHSLPARLRSGSRARAPPLHHRAEPRPPQSPAVLRRASRPAARPFPRQRPAARVLLLRHGEERKGKTSGDKEEGK
jgi:hypothetical protein